jgi:hypothetical protein
VLTSEGVSRSVLKCALCKRITPFAQRFRAYVRRGIWGPCYRGPSTSSRILAQREDGDGLVLKDQSVQVRLGLEGPPVNVGAMLA